MTQNVRKMEFVTSYISGKCTNETELKHSFRFYQVKIKLFLCTARSHRGAAEAQLHSFLTSPLFEWSASHPGHFIPRKVPQYPMNMALGGRHSQSGSFGDGRIFLPLLGFEPWTAQSIA
jgi:hypothetical protein